jgi:hypothetical protein
MTKIFALVKLLFILLICIIINFQSNIIPAFALTRQNQEAPNQVLYQARHTLRDSEGKAWQVVLYKRLKSGVIQTVNLRLVGFPNSVEFQHPVKLTITTDEGDTFETTDQFAEKSPGPNVGEYIISDLGNNINQMLDHSSLLLTLPVNSPSPITLKIPASVILEWQEVINS